MSGGGGGDPFAKEEEHENHERYLVTYADMITLLMALFVVLYAMGGTGSSEQMKELAQGARDQLVNPFKGGLVGVFTYGTGLTDPEPQISLPTQTKPQTVDNTTASDLAQQLEGATAAATGTGSEVTVTGLSSTVDERGVVLTVPDDVLLFSPGSTELTTSGQTLINQVAEVLKGTTNDLVVEGHTDSSGGESNWELSSRRAAAVVQLLVDDGISPSRLVAEGRADTKPVADNTTAEGRRQNRRVELVVKVDFLAGSPTRGNAAPNPVTISPIAGQGR